MNLHSPSVSLMMNSSKVLPFFCYCDIRPGSHMPPMHLQGGPQYCLGYCSNMRTEVAGDIGHPSLYCQHAAKLTQVLLHRHAGGKAL